MADVQDQLEIKFRLTDGSYIGLKTFSSAISVATLKESVLAQWPKADMIPPAQPISDGETLVSSSQSFELGFFSLGNSKNKFLGIWYKNIPGAVVWVANRNSPIADTGGVLTINSDGNLILFDGTNNTVWSSNVSRKAEGPVAQLLDSGNFVVKATKPSNLLRSICGRALITSQTRCCQA